MPWARWLLAAIPVSWALAWLDAPSLAVFIAAGLAVVPLAAEMGAATESLAARCGPATGGLLNATCGNAAELIVAIVAIESEILVHATQPVVARFGLSELFLGLIVIPLIGNAAEHATAVVVAGRGQSELALHIALGSSTQVALFVAPVVVAAGAVL